MYAYAVIVGQLLIESRDYIAVVIVDDDDGVAVNKVFVLVLFLLGVATCE